MRVKRSMDCGLCKIPARNDTYFREMEGERASEREREREKINKEERKKNKRCEREKERKRE